LEQQISRYNCTYDPKLSEQIRTMGLMHKLTPCEQAEKLIREGLDRERQKLQVQ
jgi:hypothetical protein